MIKTIILSLITFSICFAQVVVDEKTNLMWQNDFSNVQKNWQDAKEYCKKLKLDGYNDWFLPKQEQLLSIVEYSKYDLAVKKEFTSMKPNRYWSSSTFAPTPQYAWGIYFKHGNSYYDDKSRKRFVKCVRVTKSSKNN